ncbi:hypothetical protein AGDE_11216 [Angomonas deanei]|nr:hypothetical protein AGDE_11216 [Angomonas deanei]|eukprot:EPY26545.1 hypothetical protein AGDE_11216 [Angomonas deanei]
MMGELQRGLCQPNKNNGLALEELKEYNNNNNFNNTLTIPATSTWCQGRLLLATAGNQEPEPRVKLRGGLCVSDYRAGRHCRVARLFRPLSLEQPSMWYTPVYQIHRPFLAAILLRSGDVETNPGPTLRVAQWNAGGLTAEKRDLLTHMLQDLDIDVCLLQETWNQQGEVECLSVSSAYQHLGVTRPEGGRGGGVSILAKSHIPMREVSRCSGNTLESIAVELQIADKTLVTFVSAYNPHERMLSTEVLEATLVENIGESCVLGIDANVHHEVWEASRSSTRKRGREGDILLEWSQKHGYNIANNPNRYTRPPQGNRKTKTSPDITLWKGCEVAKWYTLAPCLGDHCVIVYETQIGDHTPLPANKAPRRLYLWSKMDAGRFATIITDGVHRLEKTRSDERRRIDCLRSITWKMREARPRNSRLPINKSKVCYLSSNGQALTKQKLLQMQTEQRQDGESGRQASDMAQGGVEQTRTKDPGLKEAGKEQNGRTKDPHRLEAGKELTKTSTKDPQRPEAGKELTNTSTKDPRRPKAGKELTKASTKDPQRPEAGKELTNASTKDPQRPEAGKELTKTSTKDPQRPEAGKELTNANTKDPRRRKAGKEKTCINDPSRRQGRKRDREPQDAPYIPYIPMNDKDPAAAYWREVLAANAQDSPKKARKKPEKSGTQIDLTAPGELIQEEVPVENEEDEAREEVSEAGNDDTERKHGTCASCVYSLSIIELDRQPSQI